MENKSFTHILQKTGVLKTFTVAKIVKKQDIDELKALIKSVASDDAEYKKMLKEEMSKISDMHNKRNPIPGIIYPTPENDIKKLLVAITKKFCKGIKSQKFSKRDLAFLISAIINELGLTQEDFVKLKEELESQIEDDEDDEDDDEDDDEEESQSF
jgi:translation elongation factor EF-1beta